MWNMTFLIGKKDVKGKHTFTGEGKDEESARKLRNLTLFSWKKFLLRLLHLSLHSKLFCLKLHGNEADGPMQRNMTFKLRFVSTAVRCTAIEYVCSYDQKPYLHNETKGEICIKNPQKNISLLRHGCRFFVYSSNMAIVTSCEHTQLFHQIDHFGVPPSLSLSLSFKARLVRNFYYSNEFQLQCGWRWILITKTLHIDSPWNRGWSEPRNDQLAWPLVTWLLRHQQVHKSVWI